MQNQVGSFLMNFISLLQFIEANTFHFKMLVKYLLLFKLLVFQNVIFFVKSSSYHHKDENVFFEEASGMGTDLLPLDMTLNRVSKYEQNVSIMEEKVKSLSETINQLGQKMDNLISDNFKLLEKNLQNTMADQITKIDVIMKEKLEVIGHQLEQKIKPLINDNMDLVEKDLQNFIADKLTKMEQKMDKERKLLNIIKPYNIHELKCSNNRLPNSCYDLNECNSNIYSIIVPEFSHKPFPAMCDLKTLDGGWTIIQRRLDGSENFFRNWTDYVEGFGDVNGEFFIGLKKLHALTSLGKPQELYIILEDFEGVRKHARYGDFKVDSENTDYKLTVGNYSGDAGDSLRQHSGYKFSTRDRDNDDSTANCAEYWNGAWWYHECYESNLNGLYLRGKIKKSEAGLSWSNFRGVEYSLKFAQMMIRPKEED